MTDDAPDFPRLGAAVLARREHLRMTRDDVKAAGGPSQATLQRIEGGDSTGLKPATKIGLETALRLPEGWIDAVLAGQSPSLPDEGRIEVVQEAGGERILVAIFNGVTQLSESDRRAVLALVRAMQERDADT